MIVAIVRHLGSNSSFLRFADVSSKGSASLLLRLWLTPYGFAAALTYRQGGVWRFRQSRNTPNSRNFFPIDTDLTHQNPAHATASK